METNDSPYAKPNVQKEYFTKRAEEVNEYNKNVYFRISSLSAIIMCISACVSFMPFFTNFVHAHLLAIRISCIVAVVYFGILTFVPFVFRKVLKAHPVIFMYLLFLGLIAFSVFLNLKYDVSMPFILLGIFRVLFPIMLLDYKWRTNIIFNGITTALIFGLSYNLKPMNIFFLDLVLSIVYSSLGMLVGSQILDSHINTAKVQDQQLDKVREIERAKNEAKTMFVAHMSHEIRTPLNSILGLNEIILRESTNPKVRESSNNIKLSGETLGKIINDILDFSKIEAGKMEIIESEYEVSSTITDLMNICSQRAKTKNLELIINVDEEMPHKLFGDELRIKQCVINLVNNAIKFTDRGTITLNIGFEKIDGGQILVKFSVRDTGIGIKPEDLGRLTHEFERLDYKHNRTVEGSGLGLSIVSSLLMMMGSKLEVQSEYGNGSTFSFNIRQQVVWWEKIGNFNDRYNKLVKNTDEYHVSFKAPDARVLVVDDTEMNIIVFAGLLKETEVIIDSATSGREMLDLVKKKRYDVIFIDHRMPGMSGVEAFHAMNGMEGNLNEGVPCVALTANVVSGARDYYLREGFVDYLSKPVDSKLLETVLGRLIPAEKHLNPAAAASRPKKEKSVEDKLGALDGISIPTGLQNCGSAEVLMVALKEYYATIKTRADEIETYARQKDYKNYTVQVHALKSSSRLIGAIELSEKAAYLEKCGDEQNTVAITAKTPELLKLYRSYILKLDALAEKSETKKEPLDLNKFNEAMEAVKEFAIAFDFTAIDSIIEEVDKYELPSEVKEKFAEVKRMSRGADFNGLKELLQ